MKQKVFSATALLIVAATSGCFAQTKKNDAANQKIATDPVNSLQKKSSSTIVLPAENAQVAQNFLNPPTNSGAWTIEIQTSGGLTGRGIGSSTLVSDGGLSLDNSTLNKNSAAARALKSLSKTITAANFADKTESAKGQNSKNKTVATGKLADSESNSTSVCNDCIHTSIVIRRREADGSVKTFSAGWDETTINRVAPDFYRIYQQAITLKPLELSQVAGGERETAELK